MNKYQEALNDIQIAFTYSISGSTKVGRDEIFAKQIKICMAQSQIDILQELINNYSKLIKALEEACSELEEYTQLKCEYHCGGGCYNVDKEKCNDDCFFKKRQTKDDWKEQLLEESEEKNGK